MPKRPPPKATDRERIMGVLRPGPAGLWLILALALALSPVSAPALAAGPPSSPSGGGSEEVERAEGLIREGQYRQAIVVLEDVVAEDGDNADAYNWLGYAYRNVGEYDRAVEHYQQALEIDPDHLGALEYLGETYLAMDDLGGAEAMLARLDAACWFGCEEYDELEAAIAQYRAEREGN
jgi:Flp pilus assembly protein TadD